MFVFGSQLSMPKVCEYIQTGPVFGRCAVRLPHYSENLPIEAMKTGELSSMKGKSFSSME
jgi:hypothetical protein